MYLLNSLNDLALSLQSSSKLWRQVRSIYRIGRQEDMSSQLIVIGSNYEKRVLESKKTLRDREFTDYIHLILDSNYFVGLRCPSKIGRASCRERVCYAV